MWILGSPLILNMIKYLLLLLLLQVALFQRGGGRGGGGGRGFGGFSFGFRGSRTGTGFGTRSSFFSIESCKVKCAAVHRLDPPGLAVCLKVCESNRIKSIFVIIVVPLILCFNFILWYFTDLFSRLYSCFCPLSFRRRGIINQLKNDYTIASTGCMTQPQFQSEITKFKNTSWKFVYHSGLKQFSSWNTDFRLEEKSPLVYKLVGEGIDNVGSWKSEGEFFLTQCGIRVWFIKDYDDKNAAEQTGEYQTLIYKGEMKNEAFSGRWYYAGHESQDVYSGRWSMDRKGYCKQQQHHVEFQPRI